jgi:hypothetical protein
VAALYVGSAHVVVSSSAVISSCKRDCPRGSSATFVKIAALPQKESDVLDGVNV